MNNKNIFLSSIYCLLIAFLFCGCGSEKKAGQTDYALIPQPAELIKATGFFELNADTEIVISKEGKELQDLAEIFKEQLKKATGLELAIRMGAARDNAIFLEAGANTLAQEAYALVINKQAIHLSAETNKGLFYGLQSLLQLLPASANGNWEIPCATINDVPRYAYRGMHLDVSRHFFPVSFVKKYIDLLAAYKLNTFHWHLTDDQGWRIEIKRYPKLQEIAAYRKETLIGHYNELPQKYDGQRYGGFYTQEEIKEVIAYAQKKFITIIPEIEMPGHAQAVISAYPELACTSGPFETLTKWGVSENVFCPTEATFEFLENVLDEVIALFPGPYIHIGGDECPKAAWENSAFCQKLMKKEGLKDEMELQSFFVRRMEKFISSKGRKMIGWDEIMEGGIAEGATIMSWRGMEGGIEAAREGHDVVMTPTSHCYFDYYQSINPDEPLAIGGYIPLEKVYSFDPTPGDLSPEEAKHIIGTQANIWTEYMPTEEAVEYMLLPRMLALAEVAWTAPENKNYDHFIKRLTTHIPLLQSKGFKVANHIYDVQGQSISGDGQGLRVQLKTTAPQTKIYYTLDGSSPDANSTLYSDVVSISQAVKLIAIAFDKNQKTGRSIELAIEPHLACGKQIDLKEMPHEKYSSGGSGAIINGVRGNDDRYGDAEWLGFEGKNFEAIIDLGSSQEIHELTSSFFNAPGQWIYPPRKINLSVSQDGKDFNLIGTGDQLEESGTRSTNRINFEKAEGRFVKIEIQRYGIIPSGAQGAGHEAWLFVDELELK